MHLKRANKEEPKERSAGPGTLYIVATPIGNLSDISLRALETLKSVSLIVAEDTRHTRKLLSHYDIHKPLVSYHSHNVMERGPALLEKIREGEDVALVSDAGMPGISDPGELLVEQAVREGLTVTVIPGASASITALLASGLPACPFVFLGFVPAKGAPRRKFFASNAALPMTLVFYESPQRLARTLEELLKEWGDRRIAVARELTKKFEEVFRGTVSEALSRFAEGAKGEFTLVVAGAPEAVKSEEDAEAWKDALLALLDQGEVSVKEASAQIAARFDLPRRMVYQEALQIRKS